MYLDIAKLAARQTVAIIVARQTMRIVVNHTDVDPDGIPIQVGVFVVGEVVATKTQPYTDEMVEKAAAWIESKRNKTSTTK